MSQIFLRQNGSKNIELSMTMRRTYSQVELVNWVVFFLSVVISVAIVIFATVVKKMGLFPYSTIAPHLGYYDMIALVIAIIFSAMISSMKKYATTIQEVLDYGVLHIPWSELKVEKPIDGEDVFKASRYYKKRNKNDEFINWHLDKDYHVNESILALSCHARNSGRDKTRRDAMSKMCSIIMLLPFLVLLAYGLWSKSLLENFLFYIVSVFPFFRRVMMLYVGSNKSINRIMCVKDSIEKKIRNIETSSIISSDILPHDLRSIQDEVYAHRSALNPVPNRLYRFMRENNETTRDDYFGKNLKVLP